MTEPVLDTPMITSPHAGRGRLLASVVGVAVIAAGLGGYFGFRAATHGGAASGGPAPPPRAGAAVAYDAANRTLVVFGGLGAGGGALDDTWTWDGSGWTEQHPSTTPPARTAGLMAYDPATHAVLLFGGEAADKTPVSSNGGAQAQVSPLMDDTWLWDGANWRQVTTGQPPYSQPISRMATDTATGDVVLVTATPGAIEPARLCPLRVPPDGSAPPPNGCLGSPPVAAAISTWVWRGAAWQDTKAGGPGSSPAWMMAASSALVADAQTSRLTYFTFTPTVEACPATISPPSGSTVPQAPAVIPCVAPRTLGASGTATTWDGSSWATPTTVDQGPSGGVVAPDPASHSVVYFGGDGATWLWTSRWSRLQPPSHPPAQLTGAAMAYDDALGRVLLFGGVASSTTGSDLSGQLWSWDGSTWALVSGLTVAEPTPTGGAVAPAPSVASVPPVQVPGASSGPCPYSPGAHPGLGDLEPVCPLPAVSGGPATHQ